MKITTRSTLILLSLSLSPAWAQTSCESTRSDPDGDGWGWENGQSCVAGSAAVITTSACIDSDGDGWGWNGSDSCRVSTGNLPANNSPFVDDDGDGWGWDGLASCRIDDTDSPNTESGSTTDCVDDDGDGWGWDGQGSCQVSDPADNSATTPDTPLTLAELGERLYNDASLSEPAGQSCASCHSPTTGFDEPDASNPSSLGANGGSFGTRNSPTSSYAAHIPALQIVNRGRGGNVLIGGQFWDGRATNLEEQAQLPFFNPAEMALASPQALATKLQLTDYARDIESLFGNTIFENAEQTLVAVSTAIAAFERTSLFSPFNAKFDRVQAGATTFTAAEARGQQIFNGRGQCDTCHDTPNGSPQVFSDFEYKNIGVPRHFTLLSNIGDPGFIDLGLGAVANNAADNGKFRTPNLRNIAITAPYMHNGVFGSLREVVEFYNTRDTTFAGAPEVNQNVDNANQIGNLGLSNNDISDLIAFLNTLTDQ